MAQVKESFARKYLKKAQEILAGIEQTQLDVIDKAAGFMADAIKGGGLVHVFGTGHGSLPALEAFPRSGSIVGFHSIAELPITLLHHVHGDMGIEQFRFLQRQEGYGTAILKSHRPKAGDALLLFSHSGMNAPVLDMAFEARKYGMKVVAVTSREHSMAAKPRHSSGKRLLELADVVIDTGGAPGGCNAADRKAQPQGGTRVDGGHHGYHERPHCRHGGTARCPGIHPSCGGEYERAE